MKMLGQTPHFWGGNFGSQKFQILKLLLTKSCFKNTAKQDQFFSPKKGKVKKIIMQQKELIRTLAWNCWDVVSMEKYKTLKMTVGSSKRPVYIFKKSSKKCDQIKHVRVFVLNIRSPQIRRVKISRLQAKFKDNRCLGMFSW